MSYAFMLFLVAEAEENLDQEEERVENADASVKELEVEVTQVGNSLRSMEITEGQAIVRTESGNSRISEMSQKFEEMETKAQKFEERSKELEEEFDKLDEELNIVKDAHSKEQIEFDNLMAEIAEL